MAEISMPKGAIERERMQHILSRIDALERRVASLEGGEEDLSVKSKDQLVERAVGLGIGNRSTLNRWGVEKLSAEIKKSEEALSEEEEAEDDEELEEDQPEEQPAEGEEAEEPQE